MTDDRTDIGDPVPKAPARWTIKALDTGSTLLEKSMLTYTVDVGTKITVPRVIWVLEGPTTIVVDTSTGLDGKSSEFLGEDVHRTAAQQPANALRDAGIDPQDVELVILTHLHWDHAGNNDLFPDARVLVQLKELRYAISPGRFFHKAFLSPQSGWGAPSYLMPNLDTVDGEAAIAPGLTVVPTPGHTPGSHSVIAETEHGRFAIAGDAISLYENIEKDIPPGFHVDVDAAVDSMDRLRSKADHFLPGHEYEVFSDGGVTLIGAKHASRPTPKLRYPLDV
jgi:glyoxylase-like metal-dependent hydrolase (beta-lactamase superfamily II)